MLDLVAGSNYRWVDPKQIN